MKINYFRILEVVAIGLIILSGMIGVQGYYNEKHGECISEPLVYASKMYEEQTGYEFHGYGNFIPKNKSLDAPTIYFSSYGIDIREDNIPIGFNLTLPKP